MTILVIVVCGIVTCVLSAAVSGRELLIAKNGSREFSRLTDDETKRAKIAHFNGLAIFLVFLSGFGAAVLLEGESLAFLVAAWLPAWYVGSYFGSAWLRLERVDPK